MISDRQKGLINIITRVLPNIIYGYYYQYIADNIAQRFSIKINYTKFFWRVIRVKIKIIFDPIIVRLVEEYLKYITYLKDIKVKSWVRYIFLVRR